jgi:hypothetical protein
MIFEAVIAAATDDNNPITIVDYMVVIIAGVAVCIVLEAVADCVELELLYTCCCC